MFMIYVLPNCESCGDITAILPFVNTRSKVIQINFWKCAGGAGAGPPKTAGREFPALAGYRRIGRHDR